MCDIGELDPSEVWRETARKARKEHACSSCGRSIAAGERYVSHFSVFEGDTFDGKLCGQCEGFRDVFGKAHDGMTCTPSYFPELLQQCIQEGDEESEKKWKPMLVAIQTRHRDPFSTGV